MKRLLLLLALASSASTAALANITLLFNAGQLYEADGTTTLANGALVLLISDTLGNGFAHLGAGSLNVGDFLSGSDELVVARATIDTILGSSSIQGVLANVDFSDIDISGNWNVGDPLALLWFPTLNGSSTTVGTGVSYGFFTTSNPLDGSDAWITPLQGAFSLYFLNTDVEGSHSVSESTANLSTVPEPSAFAILTGLFSLSLAATTRRRTK